MSVQPCGPALERSWADGQRRQPAGQGSDGRSLRVLVVHQQDVVQLGFRLMLGRLPWISRCIGARTAEEALALWDRYEPHVAIVDLFVGETVGTDLCRQLRRRRPSGHVLLVSATERIRPQAVMAAGAIGFVSTGAPAEDILEAVQAAGRGRPSIRRQVNPLVPLSPRQREVLTLMASGATNREIADTLSLSAHTIKGHTRDLYRRLTARNRTEAVQRAQGMGLLA
jgi:DNA-binding NarL/FixJ family response regulator